MFNKGGAEGAHICWIAATNALQNAHTLVVFLLIDQPSQRAKMIPSDDRDIEQKEQNTEESGGMAEARGMAGQSDEWSHASHPSTWPEP